MVKAKFDTTGKNVKDCTRFELSNCAIKLTDLKDGHGYSADVKVPIDSTSYMPIYLEAPTQTSMMELIRVVLFKKFRHMGLD